LCGGAAGRRPATLRRRGAAVSRPAAAGPGRGVVRCARGCNKQREGPAARHQRRGPSDICAAQHRNSCSPPPPSRHVHARGDERHGVHPRRGCTEPGGPCVHAVFKPWCDRWQRPPLDEPRSWIFYRRQQKDEPAAGVEPASAPPHTSKTKTLPALLVALRSEYQSELSPKAVA
jgi:hypothetical protein